MLIYYYRTVLQSACQVLCLSILGNCLFGNYPKVNCSGIGKDPSVCYFGTATSCCKSCNDVSTGVSGMFYLFRINIVIKLLNLLLFSYTSRPNLPQLFRKTVHIIQLIFSIGCEYGDRQDVCYTITSGAPCYASDTDIQCCDTCASFRTQIPCRYSSSRFFNVLNHSYIHSYIKHQKKVLFNYLQLLYQLSIFLAFLSLLLD